MDAEALFREMCSLIPGGVNSPARACRAVGCAPILVEKGVKELLFDIEGRSYIDFCCSWGALIHGHAHPEVVGAAKRALERGSSFGMPCRAEEKMARKLVDLIPSIERIRFVNSGTEAVMSAVRVARGYTGRSLIATFEGNYHGHADQLLVKAGSGVAELPGASSAGVPEESIRNTVSLPYNDLDACRRFFMERGGELAAVLIEPVAANMGVVPAQAAFLELLRRETKRAGALLIFDEVVTGFRLGLQGAQGLYGIRPDLTCLGKIVGGGFPAAAFGGRREVMECLAPLGPVYQAGTLSGNPVALEAGLQALALLERRGVYEELEERSARLCRPVEEAIQREGLSACIQRVGSMFTLFFGAREVSCFREASKLDLQAYGRLYRALLARGIFIPPSQHEAWFVSTAHSEASLEQAASCLVELLSAKSPCVKQAL